MIFTLYCLYDKAAEFYSNINQTPMSDDELIEAIRRDLKKDPSNKIFAQKKLIRLGLYDDDRAHIDLSKHVLLDLDDEIELLKEVNRDVDSSHL